jgi:hypothetical protein
MWVRQRTGPTGNPPNDSIRSNLQESRIAGSVGKKAKRPASTRSIDSGLGSGLHSTAGEVAEVSAVCIWEQIKWLCPIINVQQFCVQSIGLYVFFLSNTGNNTF